MENSKKDGTITSEQAQHLKANLREIEYRFFKQTSDNTFELVNKKLKATKVPIKDIALAVTQNPPPELRASIFVEGMRVPIVICPNRKSEYDNAVYGLINRRKFDPSKPYLNLIGNQRQTIAIDARMEYIDCFIVDTGFECKVVEQAYKKGFN